MEIKGVTEGNLIRIKYMSQRETKEEIKVESKRGDEWLPKGKIKGELRWKWEGRRDQRTDKVGKHVKRNQMGIKDWESKENQRGKSEGDQREESKGESKR